jgi:hypothetical protein
MPFSLEPFATLMRLYGGGARSRPNRYRGFQLSALINLEVDLAVLFYISFERGIKP